MKDKGKKNPSKAVVYGFLWVCLAIICVLCCKDCREFGGAEVHIDSGSLSW